MKLKLLIILILCFTLFLLFGCAATRKAYDGPKQEKVQIARIRMDFQPEGIVTDKKYKELNWFFTRKFTIDVLPGRHTIHYETVRYSSPYSSIRTKTTRRFKYSFTVKAGHTYRIHRNRYYKCKISDTTGHEEF